MLGDKSRNQKKPQLEVDVCELHKYSISTNSNIIPSAHLRQQYSPQPVRGYINQVLRLGCCFFPSNWDQQNSEGVYSKTTDCVKNPLCSAFQSELKARVVAHN